MTWLLGREQFLADCWKKVELSRRGRLFVVAEEEKAEEKKRKADEEVES